MKKVTQYTLFYLPFSYVSSSVVFAEGTVEQEINRVLSIIDIFFPIIATLVSIAAILVFFYFFWGLTDYIRKNDATLENAKKRMLWGIIGIFVLASVWGLIYFLQTAIFGFETDKPANPDIEFHYVESL